MVFWDRVKEEIRRQNTTQEWLARNAGLNLRTFQGWISKEIMPNVDQAVALARLLGVSVESLVTKENAYRASESTDLATAEPGEDYLNDQWMRTHRQLIKDLKSLSPERLEDLADQVRVLAEKSRIQRGEGSASG